jgi:hypothetical protein
VQVEEKEGQLVQEEKKDLLEGFDMDNMTEDQFLDLAVAKIGPLEKTKTKTLSKNSFIKVFKLTGEFAKFKSRDMKKEAQKKRLEFFGKDHKKYLQTLKDVITEEEKSYESSSQAMFDKLCISPECFERTQQEMMMDPYASMELFSMGIGMEQPSTSVPAELTKEKTVELVKASNDFAFDLFKKEYMDQIQYDPMLMPVLISAIAHDWVAKNHSYSEEHFKGALFQHKIYEDPNIAMHMQ